MKTGPSVKIKQILMNGGLIHKGRKVLDFNVFQLHKNCKNILTLSFQIIVKTDG